MHRIILPAFLILTFISAGSWARAGNTYAPGMQSEGLEKYVGKYPSELFRSEPWVKTRLRALLAARYSSFMDRIQTEMPIENIEGSLVARGCMAHSCGSEEAVLVINLSDGKLHCAILSDSYGGRFKIFSEDPDHIPRALRAALQQ